jgi:hypothetical protein
MRVATGAEREMGVQSSAQCYLALLLVLTVILSI